MKVIKRKNEMDPSDCVKTLRHSVLENLVRVERGRPGVFSCFSYLGG